MGFAMALVTLVASATTSKADDGIEILGPLEGSFGELTINDIADVVAGPHHVLVLTNDGDVRAAGWNGPVDPDTGVPCGQCDPPPDLGDLQTLAAGTRHSMGLRVDGSVVCWGCDDAACDVPRELTGGAQGTPSDPAVAIAAGDGFSLALLESGAIACWGDATEGGACSIPEEARDPSNPPVRILAQRDTCVAILQDDSIVGWGECFYWPGDNLPENAEIVDASLSPKYDSNLLLCPSLAVLLADGRYVDALGIRSFDEENPCVAIYPGPSTVILLADGSWEFQGDVDQGSFPIPNEAVSTPAPVALATGGHDYVITVPLPTDCDDNGVADDLEIAANPNLDCDGDGRLDACHPPSLFWFDFLQIQAEGLDLDLSGLPLSEDPVTASVWASGDLEARNEFLLFEWNGTEIATAFSSPATAASCESQNDGFSIDPRIWNLPDEDDQRILTVSPSLAVDLGECQYSSFAIRFDIQGRPYQDCNGNDIDDDCEIADGLAADLDGNLVPDDCQPDCDGDGLPDSWAAFEGLVSDCNGNGIPESCDVESGKSTDCDRDGVPDSCQILDGIFEDCDGDFVPDDCAIANGLVPDCNSNGVPDSCDVTCPWGGTCGDKNWNGVPDECELARGDLDLDGCVGAADLGQLLVLWGLPDPPVGDLDGNGAIGAGDLGILLSNWDECP